MEARTCFFLKHPAEELERGRDLVEGSNFSGSLRIAYHQQEGGGGGGGGEEGRHWELLPTPTPNPNLKAILVTFIVAANLRFPPAATISPRPCF
ncbi:hypothetical protein GE21DRAFT_1231 [Neurospora crassa]|uniref:Uncharacterized protein n=2 Tax=Neurospora crassa TaxID=5141 RepID=Q7SEV2_NEUCR|nr:hypothetical protein NCU03180 [Neurospora crassa OR74A]EAA35350.1 hypothetical protein NCU03180 [Neurospora crassa OR74A]KHE86035.1 hypothetical protein GE21DRAFT_1231 [Neurospora crassa]CAE76528.1 hypothetical protein [Neurospora crassa]|eukprot:XP_964586.1 hypothetical protein NCU03180 [Neurospora crassa OR74A]